MKLTKNIGMVLLAIYLIIDGLLGFGLNLGPFVFLLYFVALAAGVVRAAPRGQAGDREAPGARLAHPLARAERTMPAEVAARGETGLGGHVRCAGGVGVRVTVSVRGRQPI